MDRKSNFSSYLSGRFGDVSNSDTEGDAFDEESMSNFLDKMPDNQLYDPNNLNRNQNFQIIESNDQATDQIDDLSNQTDDQNNLIEEHSTLKEDQNNQIKHNLSSENQKEKIPKSLDKIDSSVLVFGQFFNPLQISDSFIKKPLPPLNLIAERTKILLYNEKEILNAMKHFCKLRYRRKEVSLDPFEYFILLFLNKHYPNANEDTISRFHYLFWGGHTMGLLTRNLNEIPKHDPYVFINAFAEHMADLEKDFIDFDFTPDDLLLAGIQQETYDLWKKSINNDKIKKDENDISDTLTKPEIVDINIEKLEQVEGYLGQDTFTLKTLAKLISTEIEYNITLKSTVIGDRDADVDINLSEINDFQVDDNNETLCLLMLKNDLCFYLENLQSRPIFVNGFKINQSQVTYVLDQSLIEFGNLSFIFCINQSLFYKLSKAFTM